MTVESFTNIRLKIKKVTLLLNFFRHFFILSNTNKASIEIHCFYKKNNEFQFEKKKC